MSFAAASADQTFMLAITATRWQTWPWRQAMRTSCAPTRTSSWGTSSAVRSSNTAPPVGGRRRRGRRWSRCRCCVSGRTSTPPACRWRRPAPMQSGCSCEESLTVPVPNGLAPGVAVLTEPMAVGWHAVRRGEVKKRTVAVVIGCGPIGLSVICMLKAHGVRTVIASDFSAGRRELARACGADIVVDPAHESPHASAEKHGHLDRGSRRPRPSS